MQINHCKGIFNNVFIRRLSAPLLFFVLVTTALYVCIYNPLYNWDMIGYIAVAKSFENQDVKSLHLFTYDKLRQSVPSKKYEAMVQDSYGLAINTDLSAFNEQIPLYKIRPIYTGLIYLLYRIGVDIVFATYIISGVSVCVAIAILYLMCDSFLPKPLIYAVPPLAVIFGILDIARYSTPDGMAFLTVILSAYIYMKNRIVPLLILLPIMIGIRTDLIPYTIPLLCIIFVFERSIRGKTALSIFISIFIYIGIGVYSGHPGWSTIFYYTLVQHLTHPISQPPILTAHDYFYTLYRGTREIVNNIPAILYSIVAICSVYMINKHAKTTSLINAIKSPSVVLSLVCLVYFVFHFLLFPVFWERLFAPHTPQITARMVVGIMFIGIVGFLYLVA